ncbi:MAG: metallophosphoesterase family protein [Planctomycetota bacterium]
MKVGIVADIHANLAAFQTVITYLKNENVEEFYCLGDIVGYNSSPKECLDLVRQHKMIAIRGNHERYVIGEIHESVKPETMFAIEYTRERLKKEDWEYLEALPNKRQIEKHHFMIVHGSPRDKDEYIINKMEVIVGSIKKLQTDYPEYTLCFFGHTHHGNILAQGQLITDVKETKTFKLDKKKATLVNPGSVGQPRDQCTKASCGIFDTDTWTMNIIRLDYNIQDTLDRNRAAKFPEALTTRLQQGK